MLIVLNKPFQVLCQFTDAEGRRTLGEFVRLPNVYPAGRLDYDSEGLVVLTDDGGLQARIADPRHGFDKTYWAQVEGVPDPVALDQLRRGVELADGKTRPAGVRVVTEPPELWPRDPPIRFRKHVPTTWLEVRLHEGRNRQIRRMTAAVGHPTLRLIRVAIGPFTLSGLAPGTTRMVDATPAAATESRRDPSTARSRRAPTGQGQSRPHRQGPPGQAEPRPRRQGPPGQAEPRPRRRGPTGQGQPPRPAAPTRRAQPPARRGTPPGRFQPPPQSRDRGRAARDRRRGRPRRG